MRKYIIAFCCVLLTVAGWAQVTRVRLKQLELAPDSLKVYLIVSDTVTKQAYWQELDSIPISGGGGSTFYAYADAGTVQTLSPGDTIKITTGPGLSSWAMATDQVKVTLDSTGVTEGTYNFATVTVNAQGRITLIDAGVEIDGSFTNEGLMGVASGGANSATLYTNTSGNLGTSFAGGAGITVTESPSANGGTITIANAGIIGDIDSLVRTDSIVVVRNGQAYYRNMPYKTFNVIDFGADGTDTSEDQTAIQAAINAAFDAGAGVVYIPNGVYYMDTLVTNVSGYNPNSHLYIPQSRRDYDKPSVIIMGESPPNFDTQVLIAISPPENGVILYSTAAGSGTKPAVIAGVPGHTSDNFGGYWNYTNTTLLNLGIRTHAKTVANSMCGVNFEDVAQWWVDKLRIDIDTAAFYSPTPASVNSYGFITSPANNHGHQQIGLIAIAGYTTALQVNEHFYGENIFITACINGVEIKNGYHAFLINQISVEGCTNGIHINGEMNGTITSYRTEHTNDPSRWFNYAKDIKHTAGNGHLSILNCSVVKSNIGVVDEWTADAGAKHSIFQGQGKGVDRINVDSLQITSPRAESKRIPYFDASRIVSSSSNLNWDNSTGGIGVGTSTPNSTAGLHIYANTNAPRGLRLEQANAGTLAEAFNVLYNDVGYAATELFSSAFANVVLRRSMLFTTDANQTNGMAFATLASAPIEFRTNSTGGTTNTRLSIAGGGTITATSPLVANGTATFNSTATFPGTIVGNTPFVMTTSNYIQLKTSAGGSSFFQNPGFYHIQTLNARYNGSNYIYHETGAASLLQLSNADLAFAAAYSGSANATITFSTRLHSTATGLGVKTTPSYTLHLSGTDAMMLTSGTTAQRPTGAAGLLRYNSSLSGIEFHNGSTWNTISSGFGGSGTTNYITKWTGTNSIGNAALTDDGTTLDYTVSSASDLLFRMWNTGAGTSKMRFVGSDNKAALHQWTHASGWTAAIAASNNTANEDNAYLRFNVRGASGTNTEAGLTASTKLTILGNGNVGIGNTAPAYILDINSTGGIRLPVGTTAQRPTHAAGVFRYNSSTPGLEYSDGTNWNAVGTGTMSSWTLAGTSGTPQTVSNGQSATVAAGFGMTTTAGATRTVTVAADTSKLATPYDLSQIETIYTGDGTINETRTVTLDDATGSFNLWWDDGAGNTREFTVGPNAATYTGEDGLWYADYSGVTAAELKVSSADAQAYITVAVGASQSTIEVESSEVTVTTATATTDLTASGAANWKVSGTTKMTFINPGRLGINDTSPEELLDIAGNAKFQKILGQDNTPTIATNANAGTGRSAAVTSSQSSDVAGRFYVTTGTGLTAGEWAVVSFGGSAFTNTPVVMLQAENANAASLAQYLYVVPTTTGFSVSVNSSAVGFESLTFEFGYHVIGGK